VKLLEAKLKYYYDQLCCTDRKYIQRVVTCHKETFPLGTKYAKFIEVLVYLQVLTPAGSSRLLHQYRKRNPNIDAFCLESAAFGKTYARNAVSALANFEKGSQKVDFFLGDLRVGLCASRAYKAKTQTVRGSVSKRALRSESRDNFSLKWEHMFVENIDVYIRIGVWLDVHRFWVLNSSEVVGSPDYKLGQTATAIDSSLTFVKGNIDSYARYEVPKEQLAQAVTDASARQLEATSRRAQYDGTGSRLLELAQHAFKILH
jgi:hypothetical protein